MYIQKTPLYLAVEKGNVELVQLLLKCQRLDINAKTVFNILIFLIQFQIKFFNEISKIIFAYKRISNTNNFYSISYSIILIQFFKLKIFIAFEQKNMF